MLIALISGLISGCSDPNRESYQKPSGPELTNAAGQQVQQTSESRAFFDSLKSEIDRNGKVDKAIFSALKTSPDVKVRAWHEFLSHWPSAKQEHGFARSRDSNEFNGTVAATALVEGRYHVQIVLNLKVSKDCSAVVFTKLRFHFMEVKEVQLRAEGSVEMITFETSSDRWFSLNEWEKLTAAKLNFPAIGINIISNAPIPNIQRSIQ